MRTERHQVDGAAVSAALSGTSGRRSSPRAENPLSLRRLGGVMDDQERLFKWRAKDSGGVSAAQLAHLRPASRIGAALFRVALAEPGTGTEVTVDGRTLRYRAERGERAGAASWRKATAFALVSGVREDLAPLVRTGPAFARPDRSAFRWYHEALHAHLKGTDPVPIVQQALELDEKAKDRGFPKPPTVLLSQLVEGDEESFDLALADALEAHRDHFRVADRADSPDTHLNLDILALACRARRRGWAAHVESPYLPQDLLRAAEPFQ
ncbi:immunity 49 family protein [Streptomyces sp. NPDC057499]|uniref:immunity 49 family protein n=1 Tax=Streptomyces sp. NPDC057499 TaxID=3346150 RepID=UPI003694C281